MATKAEENVAFRILAGNQRPDFRTISEFRRIHLEELTKLFVQVLRLCQKAGLVKLGHVALDGTKIKANASKHKAMSYDRMTKAVSYTHLDVYKRQDRPHDGPTVDHRHRNAPLRV